MALFVALLAPSREPRCWSLARLCAPARSVGSSVASSSPAKQRHPAGYHHRTVFDHARLNVPWKVFSAGRRLRAGCAAFRLCAGTGFVLLITPKVIVNLLVDILWYADHGDNR
jgi:hypothetical protein